MIIGWSLINSCIPTPFYLEMQERILLFKEKGLIPAQHRIAIGQKCLDEHFRGKGIVEAMTALQDFNAVSAYDSYLATVNLKNKGSEKFFIKNGFLPIHTDDVRYYFMKPVATQQPLVKTILISEDQTVMIRNGATGDEEALHELNKKWWSPNRNNDLSKGFLSTLYQTEDFRKMINKNEVVVAAIPG